MVKGLVYKLLSILAIVSSVAVGFPKSAHYKYDIVDKNNKVIGFYEVKIKESSQLGYWLISSSLHRTFSAPEAGLEEKFEILHDGKKAVSFKAVQVKSDSYKSDVTRNFEAVLNSGVWSWSVSAGGKSISKSIKETEFDFFEKIVQMTGSKIFLYPSGKSKRFTGVNPFTLKKTEVDVSVTGKKSVEVGGKIHDAIKLNYQTRGSSFSGTKLLDGTTFNVVQKDASLVLTEMEIIKP